MNIGETQSYRITTQFADDMWTSITISVIQPTHNLVYDSITNPVTNSTNTRRWR